MKQYPQAVVPLDALHDDPENPQAHSDAEIARLRAVIEEVGFIQPIAVDARTMTILAGHGRAEAARLLHMTEIPAVLVDDYDETKRRLALISTNGNYGHFDDDVLTRLLRDLDAEHIDLDLAGLEPWRVEELLGNGAAAGLTDADDVPETPAEPITKPGDLILMGEHRLLCGDATKREDVERLMDGRQADMVWSDPPYGVDHAGGSKDPRSETYRSGDTMTNDALRPDVLEIFLRSALGNAWSVCRPGGAWYIAAPAGPPCLQFAIVLTELETWRQLLSWVKDTFVFGRSDYHYRHENIFYGWKLGAAHSEMPDRSQGSVWEIDRPKVSKEHPTMKPVELVARAIRNSSKSRDVILDPFAGSGTTAIAAEQEGRTAYLMEIDPKYCDVIVSRWEAFTGKAAERPAAILSK